MKIRLYRLKLKSELERILFLQWTHFCFFCVGVLTEIIVKDFSVISLFSLVLLFFYFIFSTKTLKNLYYSFWTFIGLLGLYYLFRLVSSDFGTFAFFCYLSSLVVLLVELYLLYTPIFYPIVSWWEYDFRFRDDLKVKVKLSSDEVLDGRLTDLRRGSGCIALFQGVEVGEVIEVISIEGIGEVSLRGETMSKRQYSLGRPFNYGVKFFIEELSSSVTYRRVMDNWKSDRKEKKNLRIIRE
jgi:hypothetical protein